VKDSSPFGAANPRISLKSDSKTEREFFLARGSKSKALFDLAGHIVARIQFMGNKFLHNIKSPENIGEKLTCGDSETLELGVDCVYSEVEQPRVPTSGEDLIAS
jgi:hypothetical protein